MYISYWWWIMDEPDLMSIVDCRVLDCTGPYCTNFIHAKHWLYEALECCPPPPPNNMYNLDGGSDVREGSFNLFHWIFIIRRYNSCTSQLLICGFCDCSSKYHGRNGGYLFKLLPFIQLKIKIWNLNYLSYEFSIEFI